MAIKSCWFAPHAAAAYLLGAERLFANAPTVEIGDVSVGDGESAGTTAMSIAVTVKDGESVVAVNAAKVKAMFEATGDLGDWNGAAKLTPTVTVEDGEGATVRFKVTPAAVSGRLANDRHLRQVRQRLLRREDRVEAQRQGPGRAVVSGRAARVLLLIIGRRRDRGNLI